MSTTPAVLREELKPGFANIQSENTVEAFVSQDYKYGFYTEVEQDIAPRGLNEDIIRLISAKKNEPKLMLDWRLKSYRLWLTMKEPTWQNVHYPPIDYQNIIYYAAPKPKAKGPESLEEVDSEILRTFEKLGIPLEEQKQLTGVAVDAVFDSVSVATTFKEKLAELGIVFCSFSEAVQEHPELVEKYLGSVVPDSDNFFATLNSAVFSDGSFCYIPKGVAERETDPDCRREWLTWRQKQFFHTFRGTAANDFFRAFVDHPDPTYPRRLRRAIFSKLLPSQDGISRRNYEPT
jgi:hypothetical protein